MIAEFTTETYRVARATADAHHRHQIVQPVVGTTSIVAKQQTIHTEGIARTQVTPRTATYMTTTNRTVTAIPAIVISHQARRPHVQEHRQIAEHGTETKAHAYHNHNADTIQEWEPVTTILRIAQLGTAAARLVAQQVVDIQERHHQHAPEKYPVTLATEHYTQEIALTTAAQEPAQEQQHVHQ